MRGGVYFIGADGWHDYIVAGGRKWATVNVGATSRKERESFGHFFSWGNVIGYSFSGVDWKVAPGYPGEGAVLEGGFTAGNYASSPGSRLAISPRASGTFALPLAADAAYAKNTRIIRVVRTLRHCGPDPQSFGLEMPGQARHDGVRGDVVQGDVARHDESSDLHLWKQ